MNNLPNNFRQHKLLTGRSLYIAATNLNTAQAVVFGRDGESGIVIADPGGPAAVDATVAAFTELLADDSRRARMAEASRRRAVDEFSYDVLAARLGAALGIDP